jgi:glucokinase
LLVPFAVRFVFLVFFVFFVSSWFIPNMPDSHNRWAERATAPYVIGVDLGGTNIRAALIDHAGHIHQDARRPALSEQAPEATLANIRDAVGEVMEEQGVGAKEVVGIGIGLPGIMEDEPGVVFWSPNFPRWENVPVARDVGGPTHLPVTLLNDAKCAALGELGYGAGRGARHMVMITVGTGVGGAFVVDGRLLMGPNGSVGEVGHHTIDPNGPLCGCGNHGCWERFCGRDAIVDRTVRLLQTGRASALLETIERPHDVTPAMVAQSAAAGDALALQVIEQTGFYIGVGVANLINMLNPEVFVIGGGIAQAGEVLLGPVRRTVAARAVALQAKTARIVTAELGDNAGVMGAARRALEQAGALPE